MDDLLELDRKLDEQMLAFNIPDEVLEASRKRRAPGRHLGCIALTSGITANGHSRQFG